MRALMKTILVGAALATLNTLPADAQSAFGQNAGRQRQQQDEAQQRCQARGGNFQNGNCVMPQQQQQQQGGGLLAGCLALVADRLSGGSGGFSASHGH